MKTASYTVFQVFRISVLVVLVVISSNQLAAAQAPNFDLPSFKLNKKASAKVKITGDYLPSVPAPTGPEKVEPAIDIAELDNMPIYMPSVDSKMPIAMAPVLDAKTLQTLQPQVNSPLLITPNPIKKIPYKQKVAQLRSAVEPMEK